MWGEHRADYSVVIKLLVWKASVTGIVGVPGSSSEVHF